MASLPREVQIVLSTSSQWLYSSAQFGKMVPSLPAIARAIKRYIYIRILFLANTRACRLFTNIQEVRNIDVITLQYQKGTSELVVSATKITPKEVDPQGGTNINFIKIFTKSRELVGGGVLICGSPLPRSTNGFFILANAVSGRIFGRSWSITVETLFYGQSIVRSSPF